MDRHYWSDYDGDDEDDEDCDEFSQDLEIKAEIVFYEKHLKYLQIQHAYLVVKGHTTSEELRNISKEIDSVKKYLEELKLTLNLKNLTI